MLGAPTRAAFATVAIVLVGVALRVTGLGAHSLWLDECMTWQIVTSSDPLHLMRQDLNPPLAAMFLRGWASCLGESGASLRLCTALVSCVAMLIAGRAAHLLFGRPRGHLALALFATSPVSIWYAQEIRSYYGVELGATVLLLAWGSAVHGHATRSTLYAALGTVVVAGSHYVATFLPVAVAGVALVHTRWPARQRFHLAAGVLLGLLCWTPWWFAITPTQLATEWGRSIAPSWTDLAELPSRLFFVSGAALAGAGRVVVLLGVVTWNCLGLWSLIRAAKRPHRASRPVWLVPLYTIAVNVACSFLLVPVFGVRYVLATHAWILVAVAGSVGTSRLALRAVGVVVVAGIANALSIRGADLKDDFASAGRELEQRFAPGDRVLCLTGVGDGFEFAPILYVCRHRQDILDALLRTQDFMRAPHQGTVHVVFREAPYSWPLWQELVARGRIVAATPFRNHVKYAQWQTP